MQVGMRKMCYVTLAMLEVGLGVHRLHQAETGRKRPLDRRDGVCKDLKGTNELSAWRPDTIRLPPSCAVLECGGRKRLKVKFVDILERFLSPKMKKFNLI